MSPKGIGVTEARAMADILTKELGVQEERLLLEEEARSTVENAVNVLRMAERLGAEEVVVVTSLYHMPRSSWTFRVVAASLRSRVRLGEAAAEAAKGEREKESSHLEQTRSDLEREGRLLRRSPDWVGQALGGEVVDGMEGIEGPLEEIGRMQQGQS